MAFESKKQRTWSGSELNSTSPPNLDVQQGNRIPVLVVEDVDDVIDSGNPATKNDSGVRRRRKLSNTLLTNDSVDFDVSAEADDDDVFVEGTRNPHLSKEHKPLTSILKIPDRVRSHSSPDVMDSKGMLSLGVSNRQSNTAAGIWSSESSLTESLVPLPPQRRVSFSLPDEDDGYSSQSGSSSNLLPPLGGSGIVSSPQKSQRKLGLCALDSAGNKTTDSGLLRRPARGSRNLKDKTFPSGSSVFQMVLAETFQTSLALREDTEVTRRQERSMLQHTLGFSSPQVSQSLPTSPSRQQNCREQGQSAARKEEGTTQRTHQVARRSRSFPLT